MKQLLNNLIFVMIIGTMQIMFVFGPMALAILTQNSLWYWSYIYIPCFWAYDLYDMKKETGDMFYVFKR